MLRHRGSKKVLNKVKELDAFPKVPDTYVEPTPEGGTLSIITFIFILYLVYNEVSYYLDSNLVFKFVPDTDMDAKLKINIDITIAMPCSSIGADILDSTSQSVFGFGELQEEDTWFELTPEQRKQFEDIKWLNEYLREEYHSIWKLMWKSGHGAVQNTILPRKTQPTSKPDACRLHGVLTLNKVAGNFHVTTGKSLHLPRGHIHLMFDTSKQNFSHRINRLSFGDPSYGIVHPLEGDEKVTQEPNTLYQYFVEVVPTDVDTTLSRINTYQYSAKEYHRPISHEQGSHGVPGIFLKYDIAPLKVRVYQERENVVTFSLRLFSVVGGIYIIVGFFNNVIQWLKGFMDKNSKKTGFKPQSPVESFNGSSMTNPLLLTPQLPQVELSQPILSPT